MKKALTFILIVGMLLMSACGGGKMAVSITDVPTYKAGETSPITLSIQDGSEAVTDATVIGSLEMARMDHGTIEIAFENNGDGSYAGEVELPMGGEWIMDVSIVVDGKKSTSTLTFDVDEE